MKRLLMLCIGAMLFASCSKQDLEDQKDLTTSFRRPTIPVFTPFPIPIPIPRTVTICVTSLEQLQQFLGSSPMAVREVELENGEKITTDQTVLSIVYNMAAGTEGNSLFHSQLSVVFNVWGYDQTYFSDVWTLGCALSGAPAGTLTNIKKGNIIFKTNTCFIWSVPPRHSEGLRVKYLILP